MRHGVTDWNESNLVMGQTDIPLNERGRHQVIAVLNLVSSLEIEVIYSSPMLRCLQTSEIISKSLNLPILTTDGLKERNWGDFEGRSKRFRDTSRDPRNGENFLSFKDRVTRTLQEIRREDRTTLVVSHSGFIRMAIDDCTNGGSTHTQVPHAEPIRVQI